MLIGEFGNNHLGDLDVAKEYIRIGRESGCTHVKGQAFLAKDMSGSMPNSFYQQCQFSFDEYVELIEYGDEIGIPVFFSIFSRQMESLSYHQQWHKIAGAQAKLNFNDISKKDTLRTIISIPEFSILPPVRKAHILYVTPYMAADPKLSTILFFKEYYGRPVGLSCHSVGIDSALKAIADFDIPILEKHFTLDKNIIHKGKIFRDSVHGCTPKELETLAGELR